eukprot:SAG11_NODE_446_length_9395_cov_19.399957_2_plen_158_part_00
MARVRLDHIVIHAQQAMDEAVSVATVLGFTATERGYHSMGSINHLLMFESSCESNTHFFTMNLRVRRTGVLPRRVPSASLRWHQQSGRPSASFYTVYRQDTYTSAALASADLELLGVPCGDTTSRPDIQGQPRGLNGLVFKSDDVDQTFSHLQRIGM